MGVSKNQEPQNRPKYIMILIIRPYRDSQNLAPNPVIPLTSSKNIALVVSSGYIIRSINKNS